MFRSALEGGGGGGGKIKAYVPCDYKHFHMGDIHHRALGEGVLYEGA